MSKFWQGRASWKETVSSTVTGLSDGAARLRQNLAVPADGKASTSVEAPSTQDPSKAQQFLRLPIESARKLRWYDRPDLNNLVQQNLREKNDVLGVNAALRQVLLSHGINEDDLETELEEKLLEVDRMRSFDDGVNSVLVASAADEILSLRNQIETQASQIESVNERLKKAEAGQSLQDLPIPEQRPSSPALSQDSFGLPPLKPDKSQSSVQKPHPTVEQPPSSLRRPQWTAALNTFPATDQSTAQPARSGLTSDNSNKLEAVLVTLNVAKDSSHVQVAIESAVSQAPASLSGHEGQDSLSAEAPTAHAAPSVMSEADDAAVSHGSRAASVSGSQPGDVQEAESGDKQAALSVAELQRVVQQEEQKTAALMGKLQRLEDERRMHMEQLAAQDVTLADMDRQARDVQAQFDSTKADLREVTEASDRQIAHLRAQSATASGQHVEALRRAQEICTTAEAKAEAADRRLQKADAELRKVTNDLRARGREKDAAELRASAAQAESEKGSSASQALAAARRAADEREAEARRSLRDTENKHKEHITRLDASVAKLQQALHSTRQEVSSLEQRLLRAEQAEAELSRELRDAEAHAAEQEGSLLRAAALEDRLKEYQAEQGQLDNYKQLAKELEAAKARVEEEVIATASFATGLEARLRQARRDAFQSQQEAQQADLRASQAEQQVQVEAERRLASIGHDRSQWPSPAREEVTRLETKQQAMMTMLEALKRDLQAEEEARQAEEEMRAAVQERCASAEEQAGKLEWESNQAAASLQTKVTLLQQQLNEMRQAVTDAEQERDQLRLNQRKLQGFPSFGSLGSNTPKRGSGSLGGLSFDETSATPTANGHGRPHLEGVDLQYLKNVLLKFIDAHAHGKAQECSTLLPAIAAIVRATPAEYRILKDTLERSERTGNWWARAVS